MLDRGSPKPPRKHSSASADVTFTNSNELTPSLQEKTGDALQTFPTSKTTEEIEKTPLRKSLSYTDSSQIIDDKGMSSPIISNFIVPVSSVVRKSHTKTSEQSSLESSTDDEVRKQGTPAISSSTPDSSYGSPRFGGLKAVKDRYFIYLTLYGTYCI